MKRKIFTLVLLASAFILTPIMLHAQVALDQPDVLNGYVGPQLIAWSQMQDPEPVPQPMPKAAPRPDPDPDPQPETAPAQNSQPTSSGSQTPQSTASQEDTQTLTGTIVSVKDRCVLRAATGSTTYDLDNQAKAKQFEGKQVKVVGKVDSATNTIHVESIEPLS